MTEERKKLLWDLIDEGKIDVAPIREAILRDAEEYRRRMLEAVHRGDMFDALDYANEAYYQRNTRPSHPDPEIAALHEFLGVRCSFPVMPPVLEKILLHNEDLRICNLCEEDLSGPWGDHTAESVGNYFEDLAPSHKRDPHYERAGRDYDLRQDEHGAWLIAHNECYRILQAEERGQEYRPPERRTFLL